jgi:hypothetical protein
MHDAWPAVKPIGYFPWSPAPWRAFLALELAPQQHRAVALSWPHRPAIFHLGPNTRCRRSFKPSGDDLGLNDSILRFKKREDLTL